MKILCVVGRGLIREAGLPQVEDPAFDPRPAPLVSPRWPTDPDWSSIQTLRSRHKITSWRVVVVELLVRRSQMDKTLLFSSVKNSHINIYEASSSLQHSVGARSVFANILNGDWKKPTDDSNTLIPAWNIHLHQLHVSSGKLCCRSSIGK